MDTKMTDTTTQTKPTAPQTLTCYTYADGDNVYQGIYKAPANPLEPGKFLEPSNSTTVAPPTLADHQVAQWNGTSWDVVADYRGCTAYRQSDGMPTTISALGNLPDGYALAAPAPKPLTPNELIAAIRSRVDVVAEKQVQLCATSFGYSSYDRLASQFDSPNAQIAADASTAKTYYANLWDSLVSQQSALLSKVASGAIALPESAADVPAWVTANIKLPALPTRPVIDESMVGALAVPTDPDTAKS
jgi:hypothetical protein